MTRQEIEARFEQLSAYRQAHCHRVTEVMATLAQCHGLDSINAFWAGYGHDLAREMSRPELLEQADQWSIPVDPAQAREPLLLHGPVAAAWLESAGIGNPSVWNAIRFHTTGDADQDDLGKALFIADGVEPGRNYPERAYLHDLACEHLDHAYSRLLWHTVDYLTRRGLQIHPRMQEAMMAYPNVDPS